MTAMFNGRTSPAARHSENVDVMNYLRKKSTGQFIVVWTIAIVALLGAIALCTDIGIIYYNYVKLQKDADAAALAGANYLVPTDPALAVPPLNPACSNGEDWWNVACTYTLLNGAQTSEADIVSPAPDAPTGLPAGAKTIEVTLTRNDIPAYFARALGRTAPYTVKVSAIAMGGSPAQTVQNLFPAGMPLRPNNEPYTYGEQVTLYENTTPGNWEWLNIPSGFTGSTDPSSAQTGGGATQLATNIENGGCGANCTLSVGDWLYPETGVAWGPVSNALDAIITNPGETVPQDQANMPTSGSQLVTVPIVDWTSTSGSSTPVQIIGFAEIWLVDYSKCTKTDQTAGNCSASGIKLDAQFVQYMDPNVVAGGGPDLGVYMTPTLVK
jgi:Putative Flp pilus-assembly TadE/G-like